MQPGSPEHKAQTLENLLQTYNENIWKDEINLLQFDEMIGSLRTEKAEIDLKIDRKEFQSAGEGKKALGKKLSEIEATEAGRAGILDNLTRWKKQIELIERYKEA